jgi:hypothetical protein
MGENEETHVYRFSYVQLRLYIVSISLEYLHQVTRSITDYSMKFFMLIAWNEIAETVDQTVSCYIGGLHVKSKMY